MTISAPNRATGSGSLPAPERGRFRIWLLLAGMAATTPPLFVPLRFERHHEFWERLMDSVHVPYFAGIAFLFFFSLRPERTSRGWRTWGACVAALIWAGLVELIQPYTGRTKDIIDFRNGAFGIAAALIILLAMKWPRGVRNAGFAGGALILIGFAGFAARPAWGELRAILWKQQNFPVLGSFDSGAPLRLWVGPDDLDSETEVKRVTDPEEGSRISLQASGGGKGGYPGVRFLADDQDWSKYKRLILDLENPGAAFVLSVRIDDIHSSTNADRYAAEIDLKTGKQELAIPLAEIRGKPALKPLSLDHIRRMVLFWDGREWHTLLVRSARLE